MKTQRESKPIDILLVEDNPGYVQWFKKNLSKAKVGRYDLRFTRKLNETIKYLEEKECDIVMLDTSLPDSQGFNTFNSVRMHAPKIPIIVMAGNNDEELAVRALQNGAQDCLIKGQIDGSVLRRSIMYAIERHHATQRQHRLAYFDALTNLPNRQLFYDRLNQAMSLADRYNEKVGLLFIDLDGFKHVNDTLGHDMGDRLLQAVAVRLQHCLRKSDTVARMGGDEFTCILPHLEKASDVNVVAGKIERALTAPFLLEGHEIHISGSIGASLFPDNTVDSQELVKKADTAMYHAKKEQKSNFHFFQEEKVKVKL
ncbi:MAG: GGDEF domain-containing response regulator [Nitrospiraceae bacterium]|nr:MAG: GGDEF domain-containing response regulator [Nitrospiraceae bacterium]